MRTLPSEPCPRAWSLMSSTCSFISGSSFVLIWTSAWLVSSTTALLLSTLAARADRSAKLTSGGLRTSLATCGAAVHAHG